MRLCLQQHFCIREIRKNQIALRWHGLRSKPRPEGHKPILRMPVNSPISLLSSQLNTCANYLESNPRIAKFMPHREPLKFCEFSKKPCPQTGNRFMAAVPDQMRRAEVVAIELFIIGAGLFAQIDGSADGGDLHQLA